MQSNNGTNKSKTNTCTGTLNDTNYHKKLSYDMYSVYQMATLHYYTQTKLLLWTLFTVTTGFPSSMSSAWSVYQCLLSLPSCWPSRNIHTVPFIISGHQFLSNFTVSNPIRTWNCNLETVKNESKLTSVILISLLADWVITAEA